MSTEAALPRRCSPLRGKAAVFSATAVLLSAAVHAQEIPPLPPPGVDLPRVVLISTGGEIATSCETRVETAGCETAAEIIGPDRWIEDLPDLRLVARIATEDLRSPEPSDRESAGNHAYRVAGRIQQLAEEGTEADRRRPVHSSCGRRRNRFTRPRRRFASSRLRARARGTRVGIRFGFLTRRSSRRRRSRATATFRLRCWLRRSRATTTIPVGR